MVWSRALQTLADQSRKGVMKIRSISHACGDMPIKLGLELFDKLVMPILLYGSEVWGCEIRDRIEAVQRKYCRTLLGVNSRTQNDIVLAECGRLPLYPIYMTRCVKFWLKVVNAHNRYMNACYNNLRILDEHGKTTWATQIKCLLLTFGFGYVWIHQGVGDVPQFLTAFRQRADDVARQTCLASIAQCKITLYSSYKTTMDFEMYLNIDIREHRTALSRFRTGSNSLAVNKLRGRLPREQRTCPYCLALNIEVLEDEYHVLMVCPLYHNVRQRYIAPLITTISVYTFTLLMSSHDLSTLKLLSSYLYHCMKIHNNL